MKQSHKSILGLNTVKAFIIVLLSLAIIAIVVLVVLGNLSTESLVSQTGRIVSGAAINESVTVAVTQAPASLLSYAGQNSVQCTVSQVLNQSGAGVIPTTNYTSSASACSITAVAGVDPGFNNTLWKVTYGWNYRSRDTVAVSNNVSTGIMSFFGNSTTFFALLGVVVIILIISLVVVVVNRFGGGATEGGMAGGDRGVPSL